MADTTFVDFLQTAANRIVAAWLNVLNNYVYRGSRPTFAITTGAANVYSLALGAASLYTAPSDGDTFLIRAHQANTGATTFSVTAGASTIGPFAVQAFGNALTGGELQLGGIYSLTYYSGTWQLNEARIQPVAMGGTGAATAVGARTNLSLYSQAEIVALIAAATPPATTLVAGLVELATDAEAQAYTDTSRALVPSSLLAAKIQGQAVVNVASGTIVNLNTAVPTWVQRITILLNDISTNGTSNLLFQLSVAGVFVTANYESETNVSSSAPSTNVSSRTDGFVLFCNSASALASGSLVLTKMPGTNTWICNGDIRFLTTSISQTRGRIALAGALTGIRITSVTPDTFDGAGTAAVIFE